MSASTARDSTLTILVAAASKMTHSSNHLTPANAGARARRGRARQQGGRRGLGVSDETVKFHLGSVSRQTGRVQPDRCRPAGRQTRSRLTLRFVSPFPFSLFQRMPPLARDLRRSIGSRVPARVFAERIRSAVRP